MISTAQSQSESTEIRITASPPAPPQLPSAPEDAVPGEPQSAPEDALPPPQQTTGGEPIATTPPPLLPVVDPTLLRSPDRSPRGSPVGRPPVLRLRRRSRSRTRTVSTVSESSVVLRLEVTAQKEAWKAFQEAGSWIVDAAELDWEHYHNRYADGEGEGRHIIEVLNVSPSFEEERSREAIRKEFNNLADDLSSKDYPLVDNRVPKKGESRVLTGIQRIRIQSPWVLAMLNETSGTGNFDVQIPHTFLRPFHALAYLQAKMKQALEALKANLERGEDEASTADDAQEKRPDVSTDGDTDDEVSDVNDFLENYPELDPAPLLEHLEFYVNFVEKMVMPLHSSYAGTSRKKIRFNDLGLLFKPGEIIYRPPMGSLNNVPYIRYQPVWRVYHAKRRDYSKTPDDISLNNGDWYRVCFFYFDYNGSSFGIIKSKFDIPCFEGEKDITDLPGYPLRYADGAELLRKNLTLQGQMFQSLLKERHLFYDGWSIPPELQENEEDDSRDRSWHRARRAATYQPPQIYRKHSAPEHVEGSVVLDFEEAFHHHAGWQPEFRTPAIKSGRTRWQSDYGLGTISHWTNRSRSEFSFKMRELVLLRDGAMWLEKRDFLESPAMAKFTNKEPVQAMSNSGSEDSDILLLPRRVVAYSLRDRRFYNLDVHSLRRVEKHSDIFQDLKINPGHQRIIQSLVTAHFENRLLQKEKPFLSLGQDLVFGKGSGLFILLHGVPGVGKTATAEAVAQHFNKPLFSITCGNLGLDPGSVEAELKEIFRLAHLWDCVLLLDEADVFLARRDIASLKRNALVSVFLRVLEYYSGILFLTTNRVGTIDEAFKSRIHLSLYYERLSERQMEAIFRVNIRRLRKIEEEKAEQLYSAAKEEQPLDIRDDDILDFAKDHWRSTLDNPSRRWNGRQIRNAFQIASSLARYDRSSKILEDKDNQVAEHSSGNTGKSRAPVLDGTQFRLVSDAIKRFNQYFEQATGETDAEAALIDRIRDDNARNRDLLVSVASNERRGSRSEKGKHEKRKEWRSDYSGGSGHDSHSDDDYKSRQRQRPSGKSRRDKDDDYYHSYSDRQRERGTGSRSGGKRSSGNKGKSSGTRALSPPRTPSKRPRSRSPRGKSPRYSKEERRRSDRKHGSGTEGEASYGDERRGAPRNRRPGEGASRRERYSEGEEY
ncbi:hypothetical protein B0T14DRAFT_233706 [Immersiella caudata]|uniref:AAA+ ATPase domain-containing protein n=1 Tax=Immersiella caudata TaxID=314043 RepID=A0AA39WS13_9PEZI|nr:hypothetical protein B0T14DRAFT_233706 [Immersiella caudata]